MGKSIQQIKEFDRCLFLHAIILQDFILEVVILISVISLGRGQTFSSLIKAMVLQ